MRSVVTTVLDCPPGDAAESTERSDAGASLGSGKDTGLIGKRYEVQHLLGQGGMGAVYRARDRLTGQLVALKRVAMDRVRAPDTEKNDANPRLGESAAAGRPAGQVSSPSPASSGHAGRRDWPRRLSRWD